MMTTKQTEKVKIERTFEASIEDVWELWTTKEGVEAWWGPEGFRVEVLALDFRVGGAMRYAMIAVAEQMLAFMKKAGMPTSTEHTLHYRTITLHRLIHCTQVHDFIPDVAPYEGDIWIEMEEKNGQVALTVVFDAMHDPTWTGRAKMGWESELGKLEKVLSERKAKG